MEAGGTLYTQLWGGGAHVGIPTLRQEFGHQIQSGDLW